MKIYTRTGDAGTTVLLGNQRVSKSDLRLATYGTIDELNAVLGLARAERLPERADAIVLRLQNQLFDLGAELATLEPEKRGTALLRAADVSDQEAAIDELEQNLPPLTEFILPGGTRAAALLHLARCICRRAEREIVTLAEQSPIRELVLQYVNRTSDLLFVLARAANADAQVDDVLWKKTSFAENG